MDLDTGTGFSIGQHHAISCSLSFLSSSLSFFPLPPQYIRPSSSLSTDLSSPPVRLGLDPKLLAQILNMSSGRCWSSDSYNPVPGVMEGVPSGNNYQGGFGTTLMAKVWSLHLTLLTSNLLSRSLSLSLSLMLLFLKKIIYVILSFQMCILYL